MLASIDRQSVYRGTAAAKPLLLAVVFTLASVSSVCVCIMMYDDGEMHCCPSGLSGAGGVAPSNGDQDDAATDERIARILGEAQAAMRRKQNDAKVGGCID